MKRVRSVLAVLAGVLAVVGLLVSIVAVWARNTVFDSSRVSGAVGLALEEPEVIDGLATRITDQVFQAVDIESRLEGLLPPALAPLAPAIEGGVYSRVHTRVEAALSTDTAKSIITGSVERAHGAAMDLLQGEGLVDGITVQDGEVTVNLLPLLTLGLTSLQNAGLLDNVTIPEFTLDGDPSAQIAELEDAVGRDLSDDFGQIVVYRSEALASAGQTLSNAQRTLVVVKRSLIGVMVLTLLCYVAAVLLAVRRRRALVVLSLASVAMLVVARAIINKVVDEVPLIALNPAGRAALATMVADLTDGLVRGVTVLVVVGVVASVVAYLTGPSDRATSMRGKLGSGSQSALGVVAAHREAVAIGAFAAAVAVLGFGGIGVAQFIVAMVLAAGGAAALWWPARTATG
jgi:hypothetical protein